MYLVLPSCSGSRGALAARALPARPRQQRTGRRSMGHPGTLSSDPDCCIYRLYYVFFVFFFFFFWGGGVWGSGFRVVGGGVLHQRERY